MNGAAGTGLIPRTAEDAGRTAPEGHLTAAPVGRLMRGGVPSVEGADRLAAAAALMHRRGVTALAVVDGERLAGIISDRDVLRAVADGLSTDALLVADYLAAAPCTIDVADEAAVAARRMVDHGVRHLPVVSAGRVVGVISARDLLAAWGVAAELLGC